MNAEKIRRWVILLLIALLISIPVAGLMTSPRIQALVPPLAKTAVAADFGLQDRLIELLPSIAPLDEVVFLGIDESTLLIYEEDPEVIDKSGPLTMMSEPWPWSREVWASTIERLVNSGVRLIILDLLLGVPREGDEALRKIAEAHPEKVVLAGTIDTPATFQHLPSDAGIMKFAPPAASVIPEGSPAENSIGFVNFWPDFDSKIRQITFRTSIEEIAGIAERPDSRELQSLSSKALEKLGHNDPVSGDSTTWQMRFVPDLTNAYPVLPLYEIFWPSLWERNYQSGEFFQDKIVMIGPSASEFQDIHPTPIGNTVGARLHLNALTAAIQDGLFRRAGNGTNAILILSMGLAAALLVGFFRRPPVAILGLAVAGILFLAGAWLTFENLATLVSVAGPLIVLIGVGTVGLGYDYSRIYRERAVLRQALARRVSKEVLQEILDNPGGYLNQLGGIRKDVTVLFSDLRGFTTLSENSDPDALVSQLNQYFDIMVGVIQGDRGMVDKFIGDAIMAVWGSVPTLGGSEGSPLAVAAALRMSRELPKLNTRWKEGGSPELAMGLGVHRGEAVTGNVGSEKRLELTVIGDTVNLAARLEGVTKMYGVEIVISETVANDLDESWIVRPLDRVQVKGRSASAGIYEPLAMPGDADEILKPAAALAESYTSAFELYLGRQFKEAATAFDEFLDRYPGDQPAAKLAQRCLDFAESPPDENWDGGVPLDSK